MGERFMRGIAQIMVNLNITVIRMIILLIGTIP